MRDVYMGTEGGGFGPIQEKKKSKDKGQVTMSSTLRELKNKVLDSNVSLSTVLLQAKDVAHAAGSKKLLVWADKEIRGYSEEDCELPEYRKEYFPSMGDFITDGRLYLSDKAIPSAGLPKIVQDYMEETKLLEGVASYEKLVGKDNESKRIGIPWDANILNSVARDIYPNCTLLRASMIGSVGSIAQLLSTIRNKLLDFIHELENQYPGNSIDDVLKKLKPEAVDKMVVNIIMGESSIVQTGDGAQQSVPQQKGAVNVNKQDLTLQSHTAGDATIAPPRKEGIWKKLLGFLKSLFMD